MALYFDFGNDHTKLEKELLKTNRVLTERLDAQILINEILTKQLNIHIVSQQSELLLFFLSKINKDAIDLFNKGKGQIVIDRFIKNNNCG